jgi:acetyl esterase/lipase
MKIKKIALLYFLVLIYGYALHAQIPSKIREAIPEGTTVQLDIPYASDTLKKHTLDLYIPKHNGNSLPLVIWIHGGGWIGGNKFGDMENMKSTLKAILDNGFAVASIAYRYSTTEVFPAQIQDCNQAVNYLYDNSLKYNLDKNKIAVIGFSAGGHLASLIATSNNNKVKAFYYNNQKPRFKIRGAIDFYGPSDFIARIGSMPLDEGEHKTTSTGLLGAQPLARPDLAKFASPTTYIDKADPPFLIFHGDKDTTVPITLSKLLDSYLKLANVHSEFVIVKDGQHGGELFRSEDIKNKVLVFLNTHLNQKKQ